MLAVAAEPVGRLSRFIQEWDGAPIAPPTAQSGSLDDCRIANTLSDRLAACGLVYDNYLAKGMIRPNPYKLRVTEFHLLPSTTTFIAEQDGEVIATVTLIADGELGLPLDAIHPDLTADVRRRGLFVGEVTCLAFKRQNLRSVLPNFIELTRLMAQFARRQGMDQFLIGCIPQHSRFYCRFLGFERIGNVRPYPTVCNTLGVACCLDFERIDQERPDCYDKYFGERLPSGALRAAPMNEMERDAFAQVLTHAGQPLLCMA